MAKTEIMNKISRSFHMTGLKFKKHSPEILVVAGVVGVVASAVMACKATTKLEQVIEKTKNDLDCIHDAMEKEEVNGEKYTKEDGKKDLTIVYTQTGVKLFKLYGPAIAVGVASITCILASNNILHKRNVALAAAYATVDNGFKEYRNRVVERFGKELDRELKYNIRSKEVEETVKNEDGTETKVEKTVNIIDPNFNSDYSRFFDEYCPDWTKDSEYNLCFLRKQQNYANDLLKSQGYLFLNDVYAMLGIPKTRAGQEVGWIYDEEDPVGDNYVDFGIYDLGNKDKRNFVNGRERSILLDFNVDGYILDLMP